MNVIYQLYENIEMAKTLDELLASRSPESQARIQEMADELLLANQLYLIREELEYLKNN